MFRLVRAALLFNGDSFCALFSLLIQFSMNDAIV